MTQLLELAVETVRGPPPEARDALARMPLQFAGEDRPAIQAPAAEEVSFE
jgi:hypothetical protein